MDNSQDSHELDLLLPQSVTRPLWRSLLSNLHDRLFPEKLPPLQLTSRPMNTGMLIGDAVSLPWFKTVFTNLGNVINPENLPPEIRDHAAGALVFANHAAEGTAGGAEVFRHCASSAKRAPNGVPTAACRICGNVVGPT